VPIPSTSRHFFSFFNLLPQENGQFVCRATVSTFGFMESNLRQGQLQFESIGYGDTDFEAVLSSLESLVRLMQNHHQDGNQTWESSGYYGN
jgi:hypothetical protein